MRKYSIYFLLMLLLLVTAGCGSLTAENTPAVSETAAVSEAEGKEVSMELDLGGQAYQAVIEENEDTRQILDNLPLTVTLSPLEKGNLAYGGHFQEPRAGYSHGFKKGDIALCHSNFIVLFYEDQPASYGSEYRKIGHITSGLENLKPIPEGTQMTLRKVEGRQQEEAEMKAVYDAMYRAEISRDTAMLGSLLTDRYVLVHMTGMRQSKAEYLKAVEDGNLRYYSYTTDHVQIEWKNDREAVLTGQTRVSAAVFGGARNTWCLQLVIPMVKEDGKWLMDGAQASTYSFPQ